MVAKRLTFQQTLDKACDISGLPHGRGRIKELYRLCKRSGISTSYESVRKWIAEDSVPRMKNARLLADALGVDLNWLLTGHGDPQGKTQPNVEPGPDVRGRVPVVSWVEAGRWRECVTEEIHGVTEEMRCDAHEWAPVTAPVHAHTFALRVTGDSMEPEFSAGTLIVVEPEIDPRPGDYVIAKNGDGEATFKQLIQDGPDWYLKPLNPRYPIKPLGIAEIIGVVVAQERRYR